jgi:hypothetical protein
MGTQQLHDRIADTAAVSGGGLIILGRSIADINQVLQAIAFIAGIVSALCAAYYYIRKAHKS